MVAFNSHHLLIKSFSIFLFFFLLAGCSTAQRHIPATQDTVGLLWDPVTTDVNGGPETISHYIVFLKHSPAAVGDSIGSTIKAPTEAHPFLIALDSSNVFIFGVQAVDLAQNKSLIAWSTDSTAALGGWILVRDHQPPKPVSRIRLLLIR